MTAKRDDELSFLEMEAFFISKVYNLQFGLKSNASTYVRFKKKKLIDVFIIFGLIQSREFLLPDSTIAASA
jgi:hypothetical protein